VSRAREAALETLRQVGRGRRLDRALEERLPAVPKEERGFVHALTYGVCRLRGRLDHLLDHHLREGVGSVSSLLLDLLRMGSYQLLYMDGVPPYAAVSQTVEQARGRVGAGVASLVNGVLRSVQRRGEDPDLFPRFEDDPTGFLTRWGSHPRWLVERWLARWPPDEVRALVEGNNRIPALYVRPLGIGVEEARARLRRAGIEADPVEDGSGCLRLEEGTDPEAALQAIPALVQDPASAHVVRYAAPKPGSRVADLCAAPGGKALALLPASSYLLAADRSPARLRRIAESGDRLGVPRNRIGIVAARAEAPPAGGFDLVLLDVPCTGTGTLGRHPDARWRLKPSAPERMSRVQWRILEGGARAVAPGGLLVYATCTLEPEENEVTVSRFLARHPAFRLEPPAEEMGDLLDEAGRLRVLPQETGFDGAFAVRMRKRG